MNNYFLLNTAILITYLIVLVQCYQGSSCVSFAMSLATWESCAWFWFKLAIYKLTFCTAQQQYWQLMCVRTLWSISSHSISVVKVFSIRSQIPFQSITVVKFVFNQSQWFISVWINFNGQLFIVPCDMGESCAYLFPGWQYLSFIYLLNNNMLTFVDICWHLLLVVNFFSINHSGQCCSAMWQILAPLTFLLSVQPSGLLSFSSFLHSFILLSLCPMPYYVP